VSVGAAPARALRSDAVVLSDTSANRTERRKKRFVAPGGFTHLMAGA
jgi:hypothetical protein